MDLALEDAYPKATNQGKFTIYFDHHRGNGVNAWEDGSVEDAATDLLFLDGVLNKGPLAFGGRGCMMMRRREEEDCLMRSTGRRRICMRWNQHLRACALYNDCKIMTICYA